MSKTNKKKYLYNAVFIILLILIVWYASSWYTVKKEEQLMESYLIKTNTVSLVVNDIKEIPQILNELPSEYFIYIGYKNDEKIYKLEKKLKKIIDDYSLQEEIYYIDITNQKDDNNIIPELNKTFNSEIENIPCILYYKDNVLEKTIANKDGIFNPNELIDTLKEYGYEK